MNREEDFSFKLSLEKAKERPKLDSKQYAELGINPGSVQNALASLFALTQQSNQPAHPQQTRYFKINSSTAGEDFTHNQSVAQTDDDYDYDYDDDDDDEEEVEETEECDQNKKETKSAATVVTKAQKKNESNGGHSSAHDFLQKFRRRRRSSSSSDATSASLDRVEKDVNKAAITPTTSSSSTESKQEIPEADDNDSSTSVTFSIDTTAATATTTAPCNSEKDCIATAAAAASSTPATVFKLEEPKDRTEISALEIELESLKVTQETEMKSKSNLTQTKLDDIAFQTAFESSTSTEDVHNEDSSNNDAQTIPSIALTNATSTSIISSPPSSPTPASAHFSPSSAGEDEDIKKTVIEDQTERQAAANDISTCDSIELNFGDENLKKKKRKKTKMVFWDSEQDYNIGLSAEPVLYTYMDAEIQTDKVIIKDIENCPPLDDDDAILNSLPDASNAIVVDLGATKIEAEETVKETTSAYKVVFPKTKQLNILFAGKAGVGKTSLIDCLVQGNRDINYHSLLSQVVVSNFTVYDEADTERLNVSLVDVPSNDHSSLEAAKKYINSQFGANLMRQFHGTLSSKKRISNADGDLLSKPTADFSPHVCLYMLTLTAQGLIDELDIHFIQEMRTKKIPVIPLLANSHLLNKSQINIQRNYIQNELKTLIYDFPYKKRRCCLPLAISHFDGVTKIFNMDISSLSSWQVLTDVFLCGHIDHLVHVLKTESQEHYRQTARFLLAKKFDQELKSQMKRKIATVTQDIFYITQAAQEVEHSRERLEKLTEHTTELREANIKRVPSSRSDSNVSIDSNSSNGSQTSAGLRSFARYKTARNVTPPVSPTAEMEGSSIGRRGTPDTEMTKQLIRAKYNTLGSGKHKRRPTANF